jgi:hypothetical protein
VRTVIFVRGEGSGYIREVLVGRLLEIYSTGLRLESIERGKLWLTGSKDLLRQQ